MARMVRLGSGDAFGIVDDDPNAHAEWHSSRAIAPAVQPGELLTVEWSEMHDIGMGNRFEVNYGLYMKSLRKKVQGYYGAYSISLVEKNAKVASQCCRIAGYIGDYFRS